MTKVLIIEARFYNHINDALIEGAQKALEAEGVFYEVLTVPGALEVPAALKMSLNRDFDAYVVLGCIIRGEPSHYDIVCNESARGLMDLAVNHRAVLPNILPRVVKPGGCVAVGHDITEIEGRIANLADAIQESKKNKEFQ